MPALKFMKSHWRAVLLLVLIAAASLAWRLSPLTAELSIDGLERLKLHILAMGWKGMAAYVAVYILLVTFGLPNLPFQLACAAIYGLWKSFFLLYGGVNIGALGAFAMARLLGRKSIEQMFGQKLQELNRRIEKGGFRFLLMLRLIPLLPFNAINYASGLSRIRVRDYARANLVGMVPLTFLHVAFGSAAAEIELRNPKSWLKLQLLLPVAAVLLLLAVAVILNIRARRVGMKSSQCKKPC